MAIIQKDDNARFVYYRSSTSEMLVELLNTDVNPYARVMFFGQDGNQWVAIVDRAIQLVLTTEDLGRMVEVDSEEESEFEDSSRAFRTNKDITSAA